MTIDHTPAAEDADKTTTTETSTHTQPHESHTNRSFIFLGVALVMIILGGYFYIAHQKLYPSTSDAYVHANILYVAPQVSGKVKRVEVTDYQQVSKGDLLVLIDPAPFIVELDKAKAAYQIATQNNKAANDAILAASSAVTAADAQLTDVQKNYRRITQLVEKDLLPQKEADDSKAKLAAAQTKLESARANLSKLITEQGAKGTDAPIVKQAAAVLSQATLNLSYTSIVAPYDGYLGQVGVKVASVVSPGLSMMPLIEADTFWIEANYKEKVVGLLKKGMKAEIVLDMYPGTTYHGEIEAISPASGSSFSLLPPENATGNWVKVPQRFPIRIELDPLDNLPQLRTGASATVTISTQSKVTSNE